MIEKLEGISISQEKTQHYELSKGSIISSFTPPMVLNQSQSENIGINPFEFPLPPHRRKTQKSEAQFSTSDILSSSPPQTPLFHSTSSTSPHPTTSFIPITHS